MVRRGLQSTGPRNCCPRARPQPCAVIANGHLANIRQLPSRGRLAARDRPGDPSSVGEVTIAKARPQLGAVRSCLELWAVLQHAMEQALANGDASKIERLGRGWEHIQQLAAQHGSTSAERARTTAWRMRRTWRANCSAPRR